MQIAVPSDDGVTLAAHFGRCVSFVVFETENGNITGVQVRANTFTAHAGGECEEKDGAEHSHASGQAHHGHGSILAALADCQVVLCRGMGFRAAQDLASHGIRAVPTSSQGVAHELVRMFIAGTLPVNTGFCGCHG